MTIPDAVEEPRWPTHCPRCGTALTAAVVDFDRTNEKRAELNAGEMVAVDYCPNPGCRWNSPDAVDTPAPGA